ncbi:MAG: putative Ig domain-containing protein [Acidobacteria bacterium]|nr:putative Ig domain-containing protein [Acidobacteriota bacterium]
MNLQGKHRVVVCALMLVIGIGGAWVGSTSIAARLEGESNVLKGEAAIDQLKREGQDQSLQAAMQQARLAVSHATQTPLGRAAWHAPNRSAGYDAYVTESGVSIALNNQTYVSLHLQKLGYGAALRTVAPGKVSGDKQSINIERNDGVREWFFNSADGLEHGFTLDHRPDGQAGEPLRLTLQVSAGWQTVASEDGKLVTLRNSKGQAIEYGKLAVRDNAGIEIPARLTVADEQVVIEVQDRDAAYPLTIDPLFTLQQRLLAADGQAFEYFGYSVALSGNTAIVGAPYDENSRGSAYIFVRNGTVWTQQTRLLASDGALNDYFGWSVALDGDTALVGTLYGPGSVNADQGAAYVFVRNGTTWTQQQKLSASDGQLGAHFGTAVALDGNTALVGAPDYQSQPLLLTTGAAYVFVRNGTAWTQQKQLLAYGSDGGDQFGASVAVDGDTALIGAPGKDLSSVGIPHPDQGSAYIFRRNGADWVQGNPLNSILNGGQAGDAFGNSVALSGDTALIGSYLSGSTDFGAVYVWERSLAGAWNYATILFQGANTVKHFGVSLALDGDTAVVGASLRLFESAVDSRTAWVYAKINNEWRQIRQFGQDVGTVSTRIEDRFGAAVAIDDNTVLIGAYQSDATAIDQGAAYVYALHDSQHIQSSKLTANDGVASDHFGKAMSLSGDTLAISADEDDIGTNANQGSVYVFTRNGANWTFQQKLTANDGAAQDRFGNAVAIDGETLVVGAALDDINTNPDQGSVYVFVRNGANWGLQQKLTAIAIDALPDDHFGASVTVSGDTIALGAPGVNQGRGAAYVFTRTGTTWSEQAKLFLSGNIPPISLGSAVAINGDALAIGAPMDDSEQGAVYPYRRSGTSWLPIPKLIPFNPAPGARFGSALAMTPEYNQLFVGAPSETVGSNTHQGAVYGYSYSGANWFPAGYFTAIDGAAEDNFGSAVAAGNNIAIVGAPGDNIGANNDQGSAYVYNYRGGYWNWQKKLIANDGATSDAFGSSVAVGEDAVIAGAPNDAVGTNAGQGSAYVFISPVCPALTITPTSLPNSSIGAMYNQALATTGAGIGDYQYTLSDGVLPPGVFLESFGILHGAPTTAGTYRFTIKSTFNSNLCAGSRSFTVTILPPCLGLTINPGTLPDGTVGAAYNQTITAMGEAPPYTFAISTGTLPAGLSLATNGALTGVPTAVGAYNFSVQASDANGCIGAQPYTVTIHESASGSGLQFYPLAHPVRLLDTRAGQAGCDAPGAKITGGTSRTQTAAGRTCDGLTIPANAAALVGNATSVQSGGGYFTLYPSDIAKPNSANSNYSANQILNSLFTVRLGANDGAFKIFVSTDTDIVVDVTGYYAPPSASGLYFHPLPKPVRMLDTRQGASACFAPGLPLQGDSTRTQIGTTTCDNVLIPAGALALTGNATTVSPQANGFLTLYPADAARPLIASANYQPGVNLNSPFMVGLAPSGQFNIYVASTTDLVVDVTGYYSTQLNDSNGQGLLFNALAAPTRLLDTRAGQTACYTPNVSMTGGASYLQPATGACSNVPATAKAVVGNATTLNSAANGYLTFWPSDAAQPLIATSNYRTGIDFNRHFTVGLGADGAFKRYAASTTDLVVDLVGYFAP